MSIKSVFVLMACLVMLGGCSTTYYTGITKSGKGKYQVSTVTPQGYGYINNVLFCNSKPNGDLACKKAKSTY